MKSLYVSMMVALSSLFAIPTQAQTERTMLIHLKDQTVQKVDVSQIDSISFEEKQASSAFQISVDNIHPLYASYSILPLTNPGETYNTMIVEKAVYDQYKNDAEVIADDLKFYQDMADGYQVSLSEILQTMLVSGEWSDFHVGLLPNTEYVVWAYGMNYEGKQTTPLTKYVFKTAEGTKVPNKIKIQVNRTDNSIEAVYTPDNADMYYTAGIFNSADAWDPYFIPKKMQQSISDQIADYVLGEAPLSEYLETSASKGETKGMFEGIDPQGHYYVTSAFLDEECCLSSDVTIMSSKPDGTIEVTPSTREFLKRTTTVKRMPSAKFQMKDQISRLRK